MSHPLWKNARVQTTRMALLPSGIHFCINSQPLDDILRLVQAGNGLHIPDVRMIQGPNDLRRHMRLLWLLPLGADCVVDQPLHPFSAPVPQGLTIVDSGYTLNCLPAHLDERAREAVEQFWQSPRCRAFLDQLMEKVRMVQSIPLKHLESEDSFLSEWFPVPQPISSTLSEEATQVPLFAASE